MKFIFGRVPSLRFGSGYCALRYRFGATHCLTACSVSLTQAAFRCFTLFSYIRSLYLVLRSFSSV
ncbi:MAG: hypothetical protein NZ455_07205 [Bacteroidia bacterium]|nr:hypothetical protein [Bacteroidia bacterium]MDW8346534.1 hypothetical protein [Bacteroidia bacterium]